MLPLRRSLIPACPLDAVTSQQVAVVGWFRRRPGQENGKVGAGAARPAAATLVFRDAAGHQVTRLTVPVGSATPSRPGQGGIPLFRQSDGTVTAYRISGDRIGFWANDGSTWSDTPVSQSALMVDNLPVSGTRLSPMFGYAPTGTARVALQLGDGRLVGSRRTIPGWPGSGIVFWGPVTLPAHTTLDYDTIVITYDSAGHVLREVPFIFLG